VCAVPPGDARVAAALERGRQSPSCRARNSAHATPFGPRTRTWRVEGRRTSISRSSTRSRGPFDPRRHIPIDGRQANGLRPASAPWLPPPRKKVKAAVRHQEIDRRCSFSRCFGAIGDGTSKIPAGVRTAGRLGADVSPSDFASSQGVPFCFARPLAFLNPPYGAGVGVFLKLDRAVGRR